MNQLSGMGFFALALGVELAAFLGLWVVAGLGPFIALYVACVIALIAIGWWLHTWDERGGR